MARRIFLHVGTPKTGTTFLQSVLWANKDALSEQGLLLPLRSVRDHYYLSNIARAVEYEISRMPKRGETSWDRMVDEVSEWQRDVLISHEMFTWVSAERAVWVLDQLRALGDDVHVLVTARDMARQVPAEWQQSIKHGRTLALRDYYGLVQDRDPSIPFWSAQDLPPLIRRWSQGQPSDHMHLVTVPPSGAPPELLWDRYAAVIGVDAGSVDRSVNRPNESLGLEEIETLRRVNRFAPQGVKKPLRQMMVRQVLAEGILAARPDAKKFAPPADVHPWVMRLGKEMVDELRAMSLDVVGDLDELIPPAQALAGPVPDDVGDSAVAAVAVETISAVLYRTHELETAKVSAVFTAQVADLERRLALRTKRVKALERQLREAWAAYEDVHRAPVWRHAARRARRLLRRPADSGASTSATSASTETTATAATAATADDR